VLTADLLIDQKRPAREEEVFVCVDLVYLQKNGFNVFAKIKKSFRHFSGSLN